MSQCLAIFDSGNYAFALSRILERKGYVFEVVSTPCRISTGGCSYSLKFPEEYLEMVVNEGKAHRLYIRQVYKIIPGLTKIRYEKIF